MYVNSMQKEIIKYLYLLIEVENALSFSKFKIKTH